MRIVDLTAHAVSLPLPASYQQRFGPFNFSGARSTVLVQVTTEDGIVGWGEAMNARAPLAIAALVNHTLRPLVMGHDAAASSAIWDTVYRRYLRIASADAAGVIALSGIDMALWDIRGKACGWPLYRLLGGASRPVPAYAGGLSLSFQEPAQLVEEAQALVRSGYRALKLRGGDTVARDLQRARAVRAALGDDITLMFDACTMYGWPEAAQVAPRLAELGIAWLEEPFPPHELGAYRRLARHTPLPLAAGENHFLRHDFQTLLAEGLIAYAQPDVSKCGGITELLRIAALASAHGVPVCPHSATTSLNFATSIHLLAALDNPGWFEADASPVNPFRNELCSEAWQLDEQGCVRPLDKPGIGVEVDEAMVRAHRMDS